MALCWSELAVEPLVLTRLPEQTKRTLQMAAVIGREFPLRLLSAVWRGSGSVSYTHLTLPTTERV